MLFWSVLFSCVCGTIYFVIRTTFYWRNRGVKCCEFRDLWRTFFEALFQLKPGCETLLDLQTRHRDERYYGVNMFFMNILMVKDPNLIKELTIKEFDSFVNHYPFTSDSLWGKTLFLLQGDRWRDMRATLSPSFTTSKMRAMFRLFNECAEQFIEHLHEKGDDAITIKVELKDALSRFTNDVIGSVAFGLSCNSFKQPENEFYLMGKDLTDLSGFWKNIKFVTLSMFPGFAKFLGMGFASPMVTTFFRSLIKSTIEMREKNGTVRPDMIHLLMEAKKGRLKHETDTDVIDDSFAAVEESTIGKASRKAKLTDDDITSQALIFFFAGFETVSNLLCFTAHELAVNCDIQKRLQEEIDLTLRQCGGEISYESLLKMKYLDMVLSESLRKWPSIGLSDRVCTKPFTIEPVRPGEKPIHLQKGDIIGIPIFSMHRDPEFYPDPDRYDPERFSDENKSAIQPGSFLSFGIGPRSCIGNRFGLLEAKLLVFKLLQHFNVVVIKETQVPLKLKANQFSLSVEKGFWVGLEPRSSV